MPPIVAAAFLKFKKKAFQEKGVFREVSIFFRKIHPFFGKFFSRLRKTHPFSESRFLMSEVPL
jgi:hypothetical protein